MTETATQPETTPTPGLHADVAAPVYHGWPGIGSTALSRLARSPAHYRFGAPAESPDLAFGSAVHCRVLEPAAFDDRYCVAPDVDRRTKAGKADWEAFQAVNAGRGVLSADDWQAVEAVGRAVHAHPAARALLDAAADRELSGLWMCPDTGLALKLRADAIADLGGEYVCCDLKTSRDASRRAFERSIWTYRYDLQCVHYLSGLAALGRPCDSFVFIVVEKQPPFAVNCFRMDDEVLAVARDERRRLLRKLGECERTGRYPGYSDEVVRIGLPRYALADIDEQERDG